MGDRVAEHEEWLASAGFAVDGGACWVNENATTGAIITASGTLIGWIDVEWAGPSQPEWRLRSVTHVLCGEGAAELGHAVARAESRRQRALRRCKYCGAQLVPGRMHSATICHGCAEQHLGVVH
jgi:hypothetical protein